jgi:hypothetical protein
MGIRTEDPRLPLGIDLRPLCRQFGPGQGCKRLHCVSRASILEERWSISELLLLEGSLSDLHEVEKIDSFAAIRFYLGPARSAHLLGDQTSPSREILFEAFVVEVWRQSSPSLRS